MFTFINNSMEELYDNVIKKLQNDLHPDDFQDLMRGKSKSRLLKW